MKTIQNKTKIVKVGEALRIILYFGFIVWGFTFFCMSQSVDFCFAKNAASLSDTSVGVERLYVAASIGVYC